MASVLVTGTVCLLDDTLINVFDYLIFSLLAIVILWSCIELSLIQQPMDMFNLGSHGGMSKVDLAIAFAVIIWPPPAYMVREGLSPVLNLVARRSTDTRMSWDGFERRIDLKLSRLIDEIRIGL